MIYNIFSLLYCKIQCALPLQTLMDPFIRLNNLNHHKCSTFLPLSHIWAFPVSTNQCKYHTNLRFLLINSRYNYNNYINYYSNRLIKLFRCPVTFSTCPIKTRFLFNNHNTSRHYFNNLN